MDFKEDLKVAAEACVANQRNSADHLIRQAFFEGVRFYMDWLKKNGKTPIDLSSIS